MKLKVKPIDLTAERFTVILNKGDAEKIGVETGDRVRVDFSGSSAVALVELTGGLVEPGDIGLFKNVMDALGASPSDYVDVLYEPTPNSVEYIRRKAMGRSLSKAEIRAVVEDVVHHRLSDLEMAQFIFAAQYVGLSMDEIKELTLAMVETGETLRLSGFTVDKHSIGGVPGNKVTLLIVPTIATTHLYIPKTSSRAITSPSGTADTMSVLANVEFSLKEIKEIVEKTHGCIVWGGALSIAPADDILIRVERPLRIDPRGLMMASVMAKKLAVGARVVALDLPVGRGTKLQDVKEGEALARDFVELGSQLGITVRAGITYGGQPVGRAVGPALEAREALQALTSPSEASMSLIGKSASLAGLLLESSGVVPKGSGYDAAMEIMTSGRAYSKLMEIIEAQGGRPGIKPDDVPVGQHVHQFRSDVDGYVTLVDNEAIVEIARAAGAPADRGAGVVIHRKQGYRVSRGDVLFEVYAERESRLSEAIRAAERLSPIVVEGMLLKSYPE